MKKRRRDSDHLTEWFKSIDGRRRAKAVCKPCWEIRYCPYGPLVEQFPLADEGDSRGCRIFGHVCPVFQVAEPLTETRLVRNVSRTIPRPTQFRVLKRENQICRKCGHPVQDGDIHFDHIIPWSKGGSSDENNIQLLCSSCNRKKSDAFEKEHLVTSFVEHVSEPNSDTALEFFDFVVGYAHDFHESEGRYPQSQDFANDLNRGRLTEAEEEAAELIAALEEFFSQPRPRDITARIYKALRERWGFSDHVTYTMRSVCDYYEIDPKDFLVEEVLLLTRLGLNVRMDEAGAKRWMDS